MLKSESLDLLLGMNFHSFRVDPGITPWKSEP